MSEQEVSALIDKQIAAAAQKAQYGVTRVPVHIHNNIDAPNLPPNSVAGFRALPGANTNGVITLAVDQTISGPPADGDILNPPQIVVFPIPVIYGHGVGSASAFNGGDAPNGAVVMFDNGPILSGLQIRTLNGWYSFGPSVTPFSNLYNFLIIEGNTNGTNSVVVSPSGGFSAGVLITGIYLISKDTTAGNITIANNGSTVATIAKGTVAGTLVGATSLANTTVTAGQDITIVSSSAGNASVFITYQGV